MRDINKQYILFRQRLFSYGFKSHSNVICLCVHFEVYLKLVLQYFDEYSLFHYSIENPKHNDVNIGVIE